MAQLKMLKLDAANFRLKMLAHTLKGGAGIRYASPARLYPHATLLSVAGLLDLACIPGLCIVLPGMLEPERKG